MRCPLPLLTLLIVALIPAGVGCAVAAAETRAPAAPSGPEAAGEPLWELGIFNFLADLPHYPGSDESRFYAFPTPFITYRGRYLRATRTGVRGIFYQGPRLETSISLSGNPPVPEDNEARAGMPGLDAIGEIGPSVKWFFAGRDPVDRLYLQAAARAAGSVDFDGGPQIRYQGVVGGLNLVYYNRSRFRDQRIKFHISAGLHVADSEYHGYFYNVAPAYATPERPRYSTGGGYGGASLSGSMQYDLTPTVAFGGYVRWENLSGAVFADSPLVRQDNNLIVGVALILRPLRSRTRVASDGFDD